MRTDLTLIQVEAVRRMLSDAGMDDDERLILDTLEGETDLFELCRRLLNGIEADDGDATALKEQIEARRSRADRCKHRIEARRDALRALMECAGVDKLPLPEATLTLRKVPPKAIVTNDSELPDEFCTFIRKPNMVKIKEANTLPPGVSLDNGGVSLTVRRK